MMRISILPFLASVKVVIHRLGGIFGHNLLELLQGSGLDGLHRLEVLQQLLAALLPHSGYLVQNGGFYVPRLELAVVLDGKAVGLTWI